MKIILTKNSFTIYSRKHKNTIVETKFIDISLQFHFYAHKIKFIRSSTSKEQTLNLHWKCRIRLISGLKLLEITFFNNFLEITLRNFKSFLQKTSSSLALKLSYSVVYRVEFEKTRHVKQKKPFKFGAKIALYGHFWSVSNTKFRAKTKIFKSRTKIALFQLFLIRNLKKLLPHLKSAPSTLL